MKASVVLVVMVATAHAETAEQLTQQARDIAREGRCDELPAIGKGVRLLDDDYFTRVYSIDPVIAACKQIEDHAPIAEPTGATSDGPKSPAIALGLSLGIAAGGVGLVIGGYAVDSTPMMAIGGATALLGPFSGHMYAQHIGGSGLALQGVGMGVAVLGLAVAPLTCRDECSHDPGPPNTRIAFALLGATIFAMGSLSHIGTAIGSAEQYNREHGFTAKVVPTGNGIALVGSF